MFEIKTVLRDRDYRFGTKPGLFSKDQIDYGTRLLIENMVIDSTDTVLDLGCGYGPIGIVAAGLAKQGRVFLVDSDIRAIKYSRINAGLNDAENVEAKVSDGFDELKGVKFDVAVSNLSRLPKEVITEFIEGAKKQLNPGGKLYLVTEETTKSMVSKELLRVFENCEEVVSRKGYTVSLAVNK